MYEPEAEEALGKWSSSKYAELVRQGIKFRVGSGVDRENRKPPYMVNWCDFVTETWDGNLLLADRSGYVMEMDRFYDVKWQWGRDELEGSPQMKVIPNYGTGRVLISDPGNDRIVEYDPDADEITLDLTSYELGSFNAPRATYRGHTPFSKRYETDKIHVADTKNHCVAAIERDGTVIKSFGTYGTPGDGTNLNRPLWVTGAERYVADYENNRVVRMTKDWSDVNYLMAYPDPTCFVRESGDFMGVSGARFPPTLWSGQGMVALPWWISKACIRLGRNGTILGTQTGNAYEYDWRAVNNMKRRVSVKYPIEAVGVSAPTDRYVLPCLGFSRVVVEAISDAADTLTLYSLKTRPAEAPLEAIPDADGNLQWQEYDSVGLTANELETYTITAPHGVMAVEVTGSGTSVDLRCHFEP